MNVSVANHHSGRQTTILEEDLELALQLSDIADPISLSYFRSSDLVIKTKPDESLVSRADREVEQALRTHLESARPHDAVIGEEYGAGPVIAKRRWIIDPIDGTARYARGIPLFASLIALEQDNELLLGVVSAPVLKRRWWAARDFGAFADGSPIRVSSISSLRDAHVSVGSPRNWLACDLFQLLGTIAGHSGCTTGYGDFWPHLLVAEGSADAALEPSAEVWDLAALKVIVEEAGGRFSDFSGGPSAAGGSAVSSNGLIHDEILSLLRE